MAAAARSEAQAIALSAHGLSIGYGTRAVARDLDLALAAGELVCLLGPNGAGKSTLLRTLSGMQSPLTGEVRIGDVRIDTLPPRERARRLAVVLTDRIATGLMDVRELVALGRQPYTGWSGALGPHDAAVVERAMELVGAQPLADRPAADLSDGERQRVMLARALAQQPRVLVLDEITAFLDLPRRVQALQILRRLAHDEGLAILLSCHDLELSLRSADRLWLMDGQGGVAAGAPEDLVLDGTLERVFASDGLHFDAAHGHFVIAPMGERTVALREGDPQGAWLRRAAERAGFRIEPQAALRIESLGDGYALVGPTGAERHATVESLVAALRRT